MGLISDLHRGWAIKRYARRLGPKLKKRNGVSAYYTQEQVKAAAHHARLPMDNICYGYAMFLTHEDFDRHHKELGEQCDYHAMREEIGAACFSGNSHFTVSDVLAYGDAHGGSDGGGGFFGGDGGGDSGGGGD